MKEFEEFRTDERSGCNCTICKGLRYQGDLVNRLDRHLPVELQKELKQYLEWYFNALSHAETKAEARGYELTELKANK